MLCFELSLILLLVLFRSRGFWQGDGGAIRNFGNSLDVTGSEFIDNTAEDVSNALYMS
jgi:hypothetical protein